MTFSLSSIVNHNDDEAQSTLDDRTYFSIIRYSPSEVRGEYLNIGLILFNSLYNYAGVRVKPRMDSIVEAIWPQVDGGLIRRMVRYIEEDLSPLDKTTKKLLATPLIAHKTNEKATISYIKEFSQKYGTIVISEPKPTKVKAGQKFRDKLDQLFDAYIRIDDNSQRRMNITKEIIQHEVTRVIQRRGIVVDENHIISGRYFKNKFDIWRPRFDELASVVHCVSYDTSSIDISISQSLRLIQSLNDIVDGQVLKRRDIEFALFLQPPVNYPQHRGDYEDALRAFRGKFLMLQNENGLVSLPAQSERIADGLAHANGLRAVI